jgi:hypothetical protein
MRTSLPCVSVYFSKTKSIFILSMAWSDTACYWGVVNPIAIGCKYCRDLGVKTLNALCIKLSIVGTPGFAPVLHFCFSQSHQPVLAKG